MIADLGCGDAALARALVPKGMTVLSFDLVSDNAYVIEADTCVRVPLPGSEIPLSADQDNATGTGEGQVVDVVVCALSLMGTNWPGCIREAWRILKAGCVCCGGFSIMLVAHISLLVASSRSRKSLVDSPASISSPRLSPRLGSNCNRRYVE